MQINIVTTSNSDEETKKLLELLGMPFEIKIKNLLAKKSAIARNKKKNKNG